MLNFTGQTKRRTVNLGSKTRKTRSEILENARTERQRRATEKRNFESALTIQSSIRRKLSNERFFRAAVGKLDSRTARILFLVYPIQVLEEFGAGDLEIVLRTTNVKMLRERDKLLANHALIKILESIGKFECSSQLLDLIIESLDTELIPTREFVTALIKLVHEASFQVPLNFYQKVLTLFDVVHIQDVEVRALFAVNRSSAVIITNIDTFLMCIKDEYCPANFAKDASLADLLDNLSYVYNHSSGNRQLAFADAIIKCLHLTSQEDMQYYEEFSKLYQSHLIAYLAQNESQDRFSDAAAFVKCAPNQNCKSNSLIKLLSKSHFMAELHEKTFMGLTMKDPFDRPSLFSLFSLLIDLVDLYLSVTSDHEIMTSIKIYSLKHLKQLTDYLRRATFENLWNSNERGSSNEKRMLVLLNRIYLRDSRLHFCSTPTDKQYWSVRDEEFLHVNIFKFVGDFEIFYRQHMHDDDEEIGGYPVQSSVSDSSLKEKFLNEIRKSFGSRDPTRQFKKTEILAKAPFFIPFEQRVELFYWLISLDRKRLGLDAMDPGFFAPWSSSPMSTRQQATISREHTLEDAFKAFNPIGESLKSRLAVTFVSEFGPEAGIDGGGITKEFLTSVTEEGFKADTMELFKANEKHEIYPSPKINSKQHFNYLFFMGKILGKCLYDHVLIDVAFADFLLKKMLSSQNSFQSSFDDLASLDSTLYRNLVKLLAMDTKELELLDLRFEVTDDESKQAVELINRGSQIPVTRSNVLEYVLSIAEYKLNRKSRIPTRYFLGGLTVMIPAHWIQMFNSVELQMLISGGGKDINLADLRANTEYGDYVDGDITIRHFWDILREFSPEQRLKFVKFVTSVPRAPLQGFGSLDPHFGIRNAGRDIARLPTASTCVNLLKLPDYRDKDLLRQKLLYALTSDARFDLS
ncbi:LAMI_0E02674g1_1 [Lachancea mirantina]|uniref:HECT-type E3 ubiquitin transferase n=1 Tax=Lachancea mirantina TaxID=1230905 RepID=A0A1G4JJ96_9SACH|nr:LAMI_0E02674g1_1 [Lachancea mirantina]